MTTIRLRKNEVPHKKFSPPELASTMHWFIKQQRAEGKHACGIGDGLNRHVR